MRRHSHETDHEESSHEWGDHHHGGEEWGDHHGSHEDEDREGWFDWFGRSEEESGEDSDEGMEKRKWKIGCGVAICVAALLVVFIIVVVSFQARA